MSHVFDTGALVSLQRDRRALKKLLQVAAEEGFVLHITAPTLTEFLGRSPRHLRADGGWVASFFKTTVVDERLGRRAAVLLHDALDIASDASPSALDALAAASAEAAGAILVHDGDQADFEALAQASGSFELQELRAIA